MAAYREQQLTQAISGVIQLQDILREIGEVQDLVDELGRAKAELDAANTSLTRVQADLTDLAHEYSKVTTRASEAETRATQLQVTLSETIAHYEDKISDLEDEVEAAVAAAEKWKVTANEAQKKADGKPEPASKRELTEAEIAEIRKPDQEEIVALRRANADSDQYIRNLLDIINSQPDKEVPESLIKKDTKPKRKRAPRGKSSQVHDPDSDNG